VKEEAADVVPRVPVQKLAHAAHIFHPAKGLLHHLAPTLRDPVALAAYGAAVDGVVALLCGHMRGAPEGRQI